MCAQRQLPLFENRLPVRLRRERGSQMNYIRETPAGFEVCKSADATIYPQR